MCNVQSVQPPAAAADLLRLLLLLLLLLGPHPSVLMGGGVLRPQLAQAPELAQQLWAARVPSSWTLRPAPMCTAWGL